MVDSFRDVCFSDDYYLMPFYIFQAICFTYLEAFVLRISSDLFYKFQAIYWRRLIAAGYGAKTDENETILTAARTMMAY